MDLLELFNKGGGFMWPILICLVIGIAISLERFWTLSRASVNTRKFLNTIKKALNEGGVQAATEVCANTRGPVASIFHAGLLRVDRGVEHVEKAIMNAGSIEMAFLEKGLVWLSTIVSIAPMLGFLGTVWGMIEAFRSIEQANDISPSIVAGGISVALLTTLFGLVVAIIVQFFNNYFVSKVDKLIVDMEESSVDFVDTLIEMEKEKEGVKAA
ncbi:MotA/TolQ/ExbB proton channel family protein [candidate division KSB1 bacterium]|nr:MotA/TolQ/ExbB proton channel family protein [candidate division KSB1 bacterium]NIR71030.1 MotA/TolQ/ExbB proton channel family protein [candidate division KSB1 bacterium]NIS26115.1 MotA/TolQ/ExbB proton channel family protein [candidate division KSB1 bacterium]NIT72909.1 MotA/TolQ/ExbB proton channel family protein [candidate division KSB1 bacterium]NIU26754.1 MotA/TolQ/ExbB proton channel family protein [candidate division KSB1 bacterium]